MKSSRSRGSAKNPSDNSPEIDQRRPFKNAPKHLVAIDLAIIQSIDYLGHFDFLYSSLSQEGNPQVRDCIPHRGDVSAIRRDLFPEP